MTAKTLSLPEKHATASAFLFSQEKPVKILLINHKKYNVWLYPGGHVEKDENFFQAVCREVFEETGIDISPFFPKGWEIDSKVQEVISPWMVTQQEIGPYQGEPLHYHIDHIYVTSIPQALLQQERNGEGVEVKWWGRDEIEALPMFNNTRVLLKKALQQFASG